MKLILSKLRNISASVLIPGLIMALAAGCSQGDETAAPGEPGLTPAGKQTALSPDAVAPEAAETAAIVDGHTITVAEVRAIFEERIEPYRNQIPPDQMETFWQAQMPGMLEMAVARQLIRSAIQQRGITVDQTEIDAKLEEFAGQLPPDTTIEELTGRSVAEIRNDIAEMLRFEKLIDSFDLKTSEPTEADLQAYYDDHSEKFQMPETVQARHILIKLDQEDDDATRAGKREQIEALHRELQAGADFAALATEHSDCPSSARGGDLGSFGRGRMTPPFEAAAFSQDLEEIGPVIETDFGYHIIQVLSAEKARQLPLEEVSEHIASQLLQQEQQSNQEQMIKKLRAEADVQYHLP